MARVRLDDITKTFGSGPAAVHAVDHASLDIGHHEFMVLLGPSGCGKSTLLRIVAGLEDPTSGDVFIGERRVNDVLPKKRDVAMVFQSYALYPHKTVAANIEFPLKVRGVGKAERREQAVAAATTLGLDDKMMSRRPGQLSGGQRQRVALARAIVRQPAVFCMDEPLSNLDAKLRTETRAELVDLHRRIDSTFIYVTHDQVEAMTMATRIAVMSAGKILQSGTPNEIYARPATVFVAQFIGTPPMNVLPPGVLEGDSVRVGFRPEDATITDGPGDDSLEVDVRLVEQLGHEMLVFGDAGGSRVVIRQPSSATAPELDSTISIVVPQGLRHRFAADSGERIDR